MTIAPIILIGADRRQLGKSTLLASIAKELTAAGIDVIGVKIRAPKTGPSGYFFEERHEVKPSVRNMFEAGCTHVIHIEADDKDRLPLLREALTETGVQLKEGNTTSGQSTHVVLCESNALRFDLTPALFIHIETPEGEVKASAKKTKELADIRIIEPFTKDDVETIVSRIKEILGVAPA
ncbi:MAG TPA: hypothetical protein GXZ89_03170 [Fastidiosipila sp.]|jgi:hypothetical protein|nr:hypothetical protein [Fastidiosipila sp.]